MRGTIVDLSHSYGDDTVFWPTAERFKMTVVNDGVTPAGFYYAANNFSTAEHGGTHIDAPVHFSRGANAVDQIPLENLVGPAVVVDVTEQSSKDADYLVTVADIESTAESIPPEAGFAVAEPGKWDNEFENLIGWETAL